MLDVERLKQLMEDVDFALLHVPAVGGSTVLSDELGVARGPQIVAVSVVKLWAALHGRKPAPRNVRAQDACQSIWVAAGMDSEVSWQEQLAEVRSNDWTTQGAASREMGATMIAGDCIASSKLGEAIGMKRRPIPPDYQPI